MVVFFVRASVHVYFDIFKSPVFWELGRLMSLDDSTALLLVLSIVYVECRTWKMYINTLFEKTEKMVFFMKI